MTDDSRTCPECGEPVGQTAAYCIHCSADLTGERDAPEGGDVQDAAATSSASEATSGSGGSLLRLVGMGLGLTIGGVVLANVVGVIIVVGLLASGVTVEDLTGTDQLVISLVSAQGIGFPGIAYAYFRYKGRSLRAFIPVSIPTLRELGIALVGWIGVMTLVAIGSVVAVVVTGTEPAENSAEQLAAGNPEILPVLILASFLVIGPGEELLFRGVIQGLFRERVGPAPAILLATAMFAPLHITALIGGGLEPALLTIAIISLPSIVLGALYEYTDNLVVPSLTHGLNNATVFASLYLFVVASNPAGLLTGTVPLL
jgi:membrane protease YdiL (CAAX protease family)